MEWMKSLVWRIALLLRTLRMQREIACEVDGMLAQMDDETFFRTQGHRRPAHAFASVGDALLWDELVYDSEVEQSECKCGTAWCAHTEI